jgi:hypothetical protein
MSDATGPYDVGFGKPPKRSRFQKGRSGNPNGRPKGSQDFASILHKASRETILVTVNGRERRISKFEAAMLQLMTKAAKGDLGAIRQMLGWLLAMQHFQQDSLPPAKPNESDDLVMASIIDRVRNSAEMTSVEGVAPVQTPSEEGRQL